MPSFRQLLAPKWIDGLLLLALVVSSCYADLTLVHEVGGGRGKPWVGWGYTLLPSTFPLTWDEAREACEVIPGSMLARVEQWEGESALAKYLEAVHMKDPLWLANRQTLPEVLQDEQREMNHLPGEVVDTVGGGVGGGGGDFNRDPGEAGPLSLAGSDLTVGGDVGVTLRCAIYILGVGIVHELCSSRSVSAALCVQRLSTDRPLSNVCPPSIHHTWLLVSRQTLSTSDKEIDDTDVSITGLQQCHHRQLGQTYCHYKNGWSKTICPSAGTQTHNANHHKGKIHRKYHHGVGHGHFRQSHKGSATHQGSSISNSAEASLAIGQDFLKAYSSSNQRSKRQATDNPLEEYIAHQRLQRIMGLNPTAYRTLPLNGKTLDLDGIERLMLGFNNNKKQKKNKSRRGRKNNQNNSKPKNAPQNRTEAQAPKVEQVPITEIPIVPLTKATKTVDAEQHAEKNPKHKKNPTTMKPSNNESDMGSDGIGAQSNSGGLPELNEDDIEIIVTVSENGSQITNTERKQDFIKPDTTQNQNIEGEKEESGPSITVGVGPIFVQDAMPEVEIIETAEVVEPMDESRMAEIIHVDDSNKKEKSQDNAISFPEVAKETDNPDPTTSSSLVGQSHSATGSDPVTEVFPEITEPERETSKPTTVTEADEVEAVEITKSTVTKPEVLADEPKLEDTIGKTDDVQSQETTKGIIQKAKQEVQLKEAISEDIVSTTDEVQPKETNLEGVVVTPNKMVTMQGPSGFNEIVFPQNDNEVIIEASVVALPTANSGTSSNTMSEDLKDNGQTQTSENPLSKPLEEEKDDDNVAMEEDMTEKEDAASDDTKEVEDMSEEEVDDEQQDESQPISSQIEAQNKEDEERDMRPKRPGKYILIGQIFKGIFG